MTPPLTILRVAPDIPFVELLASARRGEAQALSILTERFYPAVQELVHHRLAADVRSGRPWLTARFSTGDVVHDVFHGVLRDLDAFAGDTEEAFVGYLVVVTRNRIIDMVRFHEADRRDGRRGGPLPEGLDPAAPVSGPASMAASVERIELIQRALQQFDPREQHLLRARIEGQATFAELAEQLGYETESGARRAFYAAQARLSLILKDI